MKLFFETIKYIFFWSLFVIGGLLIYTKLAPSESYRLFSITSGSMEPIIKTGSVVIAQAQPSYEVKDIIAFSTSSNTIVTHRITDTTMMDDETLFVTKGDGNNTSDQNQITQQQIIGKVTTAIPYVGYAIEFMKQPFGFALLILIPAVLIMYEEFKNIVSEILRIRSASKVLVLAIIISSTLIISTAIALFNDSEESTGNSITAASSYD